MVKQLLFKDYLCCLKALLFQRYEFFTFPFQEILATYYWRTLIEADIYTFIIDFWLSLISCLFLSLKLILFLNCSYDENLYSFQKIPNISGNSIN